MEEIIVESYIPIVPDFEFIKFPFEERKLVIDEILMVIKEVKFNEVPYISYYEFTLKEIDELPDTLLKVYFKNFLLFLQIKPRFLNFTLKLKIKLSEVRYYSHPDQLLSEIEQRSAANHVGAELLSKKVFEIIAASQIARPGSLALGDGIVTVQNLKYETIPSVPNLRIARDEIVDKGYPVFNFFQFPKLWKWLVENNLLFVDNPKNKFQLAINAYSHLFDSQSITNNLVYCMLALEALYVKGDRNIKKQLVANVQAFLGPIKDYKDLINEMYKIRCDFYHGSFPIQPLHKEGGDVPEYQYKIEQSELISKIILIVTLQNLYLNNAVEIN